jgi:hypothetical protein
MQISLCDLRATSSDLRYNPYPRYGGKKWARILGKRVEEARVDNPGDPIRYDEYWKNVVERCYSCKSEHCLDWAGFVVSVTVGCVSACLLR